MPNLEDELLTGAEARMLSFIDDSREEYNKFGVADIHTKVLMGDVGEQIVEYATDLQADMIVMGTHGYKGLEKIMFGQRCRQDRTCRSLSGDND